MASYFREARNVELSLLYYLETNLDTDWSGTTVEKTFKKAYAKDISLPIVVARLADTVSTRLEIGADTLDDRHLIIIDVFAKSDGQRLDMADYIKDKLKDGWVHYDWSRPSGGGTTLDSSANGRDYVTSFIIDTKVDIGESEDEKDHHRHSISVRVRKSS